jgi:DNA-binding CsgD family transcriptional regulator/PAS domain-containing protein
VNRCDDNTGALLADLYRGATNPDQWPTFLARLAACFGSGAAAMRVTGLSAPVVFHSWTVGIDAQANRLYQQETVLRDVFRDALAAAPVGVVQVSHRLISDREFEHSENYQAVFRPNGNFYAMGTHVARVDDRAVHIGVHRPRSEGPFSESERRHLEYFSPHLGEAFKLMRVLDQFQSAMQQSFAALDCLGYGVWMTGPDLRCRWMNAAAEDAMQMGLHGLAVNRDVLMLRNADDQSLLDAAVRRLTAGESSLERLPLGTSGCSLMLFHDERNPAIPGLAGEGAITVFLLDAQRLIHLNADELRQNWRLTVAEVRLVGEFLRGHDLTEAAGCLGISPHTARTQIKSVMQKLGVNRQAELMRKLLMASSVVQLARR